MYHILREFADSYGLLMLFLTFVGVVVFLFRPGAKEAHKHSSEIPFLYEDAPLPPRTGKDVRDANQEA